MTSGPVPASAQWSAIPFPRSTRRCMTSIRARYYPDESLATVRGRHGVRRGKLVELLRQHGPFGRRQRRGPAHRDRHAEGQVPRLDEEGRQQSVGEGPHPARRPGSDARVLRGFRYPSTVEYYYYDQLGSAYSDQPDDASLWTIERFADEVEQVRKALGLSRENFVLQGHSWGGILAIEYALRHQENVKALVISNMMASIPAYNEYARTVLMPRMDQKALAQILALEKKGDFENPRYEELLIPNFYQQHILRMPAEQWPDPVVRAFAHLNRKIYVPMQGPSEMGASGVLEKWDRTADLKSIQVPTLVIGARYDTMDPKHMEWMSKQLPKGRYLHCPNGSHLAMYDDGETYFGGLIGFLQSL